MSDQLARATFWFLDSTSILIVIGTLADILPAFAALFSIIWACINIYESRTFQRLLAKVMRRAAPEE